MPIALTDVKLATLSELAAELEKADKAIAILQYGKDCRIWKIYRRRIYNELMRRTPVDAATAKLTDAQLLKELQKP